MNKNSVRRYSLAAILLLVLTLAVGYYYFLASVSRHERTAYVLIDTDDTVDSVYSKLAVDCRPAQLQALHALVRHTGYAAHIHPGRYAIDGDMSAIELFRNLKNGKQQPVMLTVPSVRTVDRLAAELAKHLMADSAAIAAALHDPATCAALGYDTTTIAAMFVPNTYEVYWTTTVPRLLERLHKESDAFWTADRKAQADALKLTPVQVVTLASIVDEETANNAEKPLIARMYYNRLTLRNGEYPSGMPLQADPTIKFAWKKFDLKRIYHNLLAIDSPYNTYRYAGLPPGPIRIPTVAGIDAVLRMPQHNYIYMCAKEDFSGTHNFAVTYKEHLANAARYTKALNERGIK